MEVSKEIGSGRVRQRKTREKRVKTLIILVDSIDGLNGEGFMPDVALLLLEIHINFYVWSHGIWYWSCRRLCIWRIVVDVAILNFVGEVWKGVRRWRRVVHDGYCDVTA